MPGIDETGLAQVRDDRREELGRNGEVIDPVAARAVGAVKLLELVLELSDTTPASSKVPGAKTRRLANSGQISRKSEPPFLLSVFSYSARMSSSVQSRRAKPTMAHRRAGYRPGPGDRAPARACDGRGRPSSRRGRSRRARAPGPGASACRNGLDSVTLVGSGIADPPANAVAWVEREKATQQLQRESSARR